MKKVTWDIKFVQKNETVTVRNCVSVGFTNVGTSICYINGAPIPANGNFFLGSDGGINTHQEFSIAFAQTGENNLLVTQTLLANECD